MDETTFKQLEDTFQVLQDLNPRTWPRWLHISWKTLADLGFHEAGCMKNFDCSEEVIMYWQFVSYSVQDFLENTP